jgi:hypothetical protein
MVFASLTQPASLKAGAMFRGILNFRRPIRFSTSSAGRCRLAPVPAAAPFQAAAPQVEPTAQPCSSMGSAPEYSEQYLARQIVASHGRDRASGGSACSAASSSSSSDNSSSSSRSWRSRARFSPYAVRPCNGPWISYVHGHVDSSSSGSGDWRRGSSGSSSGSITAGAVTQ